MELLEVYETITKLIPTTNKMDVSCFGTLICVLMEEWCKENDYDITKFVNNIHEIVMEVQEGRGKY